MNLVSLDELQALVEQALIAVGVQQLAATATARALVHAEASGVVSHGVSRLPQYVGHIRAGRVRAEAQPVLTQKAGTAAIMVDANGGLAYPACDIAIGRCRELAPETGVVFAGVHHSHHFGVASYHLLAAAEHGLAGLAFSNSPAAMPAWNGRRAIYGTNPVAMVFPRRQASPIVVDASLSAVARGKLVIAAKRGETIPDGWAADSNGVPTNDARAGLAGLMLPAGGLKGAVLAMGVELICSALAGAGLAFQNPSYFDESDVPVNIGHAFLLFDPEVLTGREHYYAQVEALVDATMTDATARLPGQRAEACRELAARQGVHVEERLLAEIVALARQAQ